MPLTATAPHPLFVLPPERGRTYLNWARWLAYAEGIILVLGAAMMISRGQISQIKITVGLAILSLTLGWQVGRGSAGAAMILLGLSISRGVMTFIPGAPEWWTTFPPLTLLELFVFGQGARAAIAHAQSEPGTQPTFWARSYFVDLVVAVILGALSFVAMNIHVPTGEGLMGVGKILIVLLGIFHFFVAVVLLVSGTKARSGARWGRRVRSIVYWLLLGEIVVVLRTAI